MMSPEDLCATQLETVPEYNEELQTGSVPSHEGVGKPKRKFGLPSYLLQPKPSPSVTEDSPEEVERGIAPLTPPSNRKGILETFRPRSKSDVTYKTKRPSFLNQLKRKNVRRFILHKNPPQQTLEYFRTAMLFPPIEDLSAH